MITKLQEIINYKKEEFTFRRNQTNNFELQSKIDQQKKPRKFLEHLNNANKFNLIAEVKKASPSKGLIRKDFDPLELAKCYQNGGASCLSVLTDEKYFQGNNKYIDIIKKEVDLPILRKDFIIDPWQIKESRSLGADCILLIMAALNLEDAILLEKEAIDLGMDVLIETHTEEEVKMANKLKSKLVGVNNRNLKTMEVDINNTLKLKKFIDPDKIIVAESGLKTHTGSSMVKRKWDNKFFNWRKPYERKRFNLSNKKNIRN